MKHLEKVLRHSSRGGSRIGWSAISQFQECELSYFYANVVPHPSGGFGVAGGEARALWVGTRVHEALAAWYLSSPHNAHYDADAGVAALETGARESGLLESEPENAAAWTEEALGLFRRYAAECGPNGPTPDGDYFRIAFDAEGPLVEREFEIDLGWGGYFYTTRIDAIGWDRATPGRLLVVEHKTCDVSRAGSALRGYALDPQLSGETLAVQAAWQQPVVPVINLIKKRAAAKSTCRSWDPMPRSPADLEKFRIDTVRTLKRMDERVEEYLALVERGVPPLDAGNLVFHGSPKGRICADQGRQCTFYDFCYRKSTRMDTLAGTNPRFPSE